MPIKPENYHLYPGGSPWSKEWGELRERILDRDEHRCKFCRAPNHELVFRDPDGRWEIASDLGEIGDAVKIVLTIAHLDHDPSHNGDANLAALCQRCHNRHDAPHRRANAARTRAAKRAARDLFDGTPP